MQPKILASNRKLHCAMRETIAKARPDADGGRPKAAPALARLVHLAGAVRLGRIRVGLPREGSLIWFVVKLPQIDRPVPTYTDVDVRRSWCRDPLACPYRLEALELVEDSEPGSGEGFCVHPERPYHYD